VLQILQELGRQSTLNGQLGEANKCAWPPQKTVVMDACKDSAVATLLKLIKYPCNH